MADTGTRAMAAFALAALTWTLAAPGAALAEEERRDNTMSTRSFENQDPKGTLRAGPDEQGDNQMVIERKAKKPQEMPDMGPIYVVPQVNRGPGQTPVIIPVQPGADRKNRP